MLKIESVSSHFFRDAMTRQLGPWRQRSAVELSTSLSRQTARILLVVALMPEVGVSEFGVDIFSECIL